MYHSLAEASKYALYVDAQYFAIEARVFGTAEEAARADALVAEAHAAYLAECGSAVHAGADLMREGYATH